MARVTRLPEPWLAVLGLTSLIAWLLLALYWNDLALPAFCSAGSLWNAPPVALSFALLVNAPTQPALCWTLMIAAMMAPAIIAPLRHVHDRSFARRRTRAMLLFTAGYATIWMAAAVPLHVLALAAAWLAPTPPALLFVVLAAAVLWQVSPAKQWCMNRCHRKSYLAAFGAAADRDALLFGLTNGLACVGVCWALMIVPLVIGIGHVAGMAAVAGFIAAERLEDPAPLAWRWRGAGKAGRIVATQIRSRVAAPTH